jgi:hypothetical protein
MKMRKIFITLLLASILVVTQVSVALAAPIAKTAESFAGTVTAVTLETDASTGVSTVLVELDSTQTVRISQETAYDLGLLDYDVDGNPFIVDPLPGYIEIDPQTVIPDEEESHHPVAGALALFFSDIEGLDYSTIMEAHEAGNGFGVIAQSLWMIRKLGGTSDDFVHLLEAKRDGDYQDFPLEDGTIPTTWGQLRKAVSENLGTVMSNHQGNNGNHGNGNNGNGNSNPGSGNNGNGNGNHGNGNNGNGNNGGGNGNGHKP